MATSRPTLLVTIAATLWGTTGTVAHFLGEISPLAVGATTMGVGGIILAWISRAHLREVARDRRASVWVILGAIGVGIYPLAFYTGMDLAGVAVGNVIALGSGPLVAALLEWLIQKRSPGIGWAVATSLGALGLIVISWSGHEQTTANPEAFEIGLVLALLAGVSYGAYSYAMARIVDIGHSSRTAAGATFGLGSVPLVIVALVHAPSIAASPESWPGLLYLIAGPMVISYLLFSAALRHLNPSVVLTIALAEPAVATTLAIAVVGERFDVVGLAGIVLIAVSVMIAARVPHLKMFQTPVEHQNGVSEP